ncbi:hypothetical protein [Kribbella sp. DT2]|uniref:hypothetical protein n=1 Tax=Kribbella sp. DT2 TaxID=3393427 RepID=UPI003CEC47BC
MTVEAMLPTAINWDNVIPFAGTGLAVLSAVVAIWQARIARTAAKSAGTSATAASVQAQATVEQANLLRRQVDSEAEERHKRSAPVYRVRMLADEEWGVLTAKGRSTGTLTPFHHGHTPPVTDWIKKQTIEVTLVAAPGEMNLGVDLRDSPSALIFDSGPAAISLNGVARFSLLTPNALVGRQLTLRITSSAASQGDSRRWTSEHSIAP